MPTSSDTSNGSWWNFLGAGAGDLASYLGNRDATGALITGNNNAIGTQQQIQDRLTGIYGGQRALGGGADTALSGTLGLGGPANYDAFLNSPGFKGSLGLGNQAIERAASANGSLYTPNMLNDLGKYDTTYASQNYNNYVNQLLQSAGLGAQGNQALGQNIYGTGSNISTLQQNAGQNRAAGAANNSGIASNLLGKVPWNQVGNAVSGWWNGSGNNDSSGGTSYGAGSSDTTDGTYNGGAFGGGAPLYDPNTGGYPGADGTNAAGNYDWFSGGDSSNPS